MVYQYIKQLDVAAGRDIMISAEIVVYAIASLYRLNIEYGAGVLYSIIYKPNA